MKVSRLAWRRYWERFVSFLPWNCLLLAATKLLGSCSESFSYYETGFTDDSVVTLHLFF